MLNRLLLVLDVLLLVAAGTLGLHLYRVWTAGDAGAAAAAAPAAPAPAAPGAAAAPAAPAPALATFGVVAERNLFSPTRNEATPEPPKPGMGQSAVATPAAPKPRLYGVVIGRDGGARAYLEDPRTRKVFGYAIGDTVAESHVEQINADRVVLRRGAESFEVLLRDPAKPRPAAPAGAAPTMPGAPPGMPGAVVPGGVPGGGIPRVPVPGQPYDPLMQPGATPAIPGAPIVPGQPQVVPGQPPGPPSWQLPSARPIIPGRSPRMPGTVPSPPSAPAPGQPPGGAGS